MSIKRRAISADQKQERHQAIVEHAWAHFQQQPYDAVNMLDIATSLGLAKGTLYSYFSTKEALFLAVLEQQLAEWFDELEAGLGMLGTEAGVEAVAALITRLLLERPALVRLIAILHVTLERNIDYNAARRFKHLLLAHITTSGAALEKCLPFLAGGQGAAVLLQIYALLIGVQHLADPAPVVREVLAGELDLAIFKVDFGQLFQTSLLALLTGTRSSLV